jgi:hypothetical protein
MALLPCRTCGSLLRQARWMTSGITYDARSSDVEDIIEENLASARLPPGAAAPLQQRIVLVCSCQWYHEKISEVTHVQDKTTYRKRGSDSPFRLLTTRREAIALYREIWRISALFDWPDQRGRLWWVDTIIQQQLTLQTIVNDAELPVACRRDVLRESARQEFEAARFEDDPEIVRRCDT